MTTLELAAMMTAVETTMPAQAAMMMLELAEMTIPVAAVIPAGTTPDLVETTPDLVETMEPVVAAIPAAAVETAVTGAETVS